MNLTIEQLGQMQIAKRELCEVSQKEMAYARWYMDLAKRTAEMSHCVRNKVGALIEVDGNPTSFGWNGKPTGFDNICELPGQDVTDPITRHAERNTLERFMSRTDFTHHGTMYVTLSPCIDCSITIVTRAKLATVYFETMYRDTTGLAYLLHNKVKVYQLTENTIFELTLVEQA